MFKEFKYNYIIIPAIATIFSLILYKMIATNLAWHSHLHKPMLYPSKHIFRFICIGSMLFLTSITSVIWNKMSHSNNFQFVMKSIFIIMTIIFGHTYALFVLKNLKLSFVLKVLETLSLIYLAARFIKEAKIISWSMIPYIAWNIFICALEYQIYLLNL